MHAQHTLAIQKVVESESAGLHVTAHATQAANDLPPAEDLNHVMGLQAKISDLLALNAALNEKCTAAEKGKQEAEERAARAARESAEQLLLVESRIGSLQVEIDQVRHSEVSKWKDQVLSLEASLRGRHYSFASSVKPPNTFSWFREGQAA